MSLKSEIFRAIQKKESPLALMERLGIKIEEIPPNVSDSDLWLLLIQISSSVERTRMFKKTYIKSIDEVINLIQKSTNIVAVIGAGASVGPDFRSPGGLYDQISKSGALEDPYSVFDMEYFQNDPSVFWRFAHLIFPSVNPEHSQAHYFLAELEKRGKLLRCYSQNVDTLEVGIPDDKLRCVHGSWRENKCLNCGKIYSIEDLREYVNNQQIPTCKECGGQIKPGIVFFGQKTNIDDEDIDFDSDHVDLLIVIGTSLRVAPVSYIPQVMYKAPSILINREPVQCTFSAELLGEGDQIILELKRKLGWNDSNENNEDKKENENDTESDQFVFVEPNKYLIKDQDGTSPRFVETGRSLFMINPTDPAEIDFFE